MLQTVYTWDRAIKTLQRILQDPERSQPQWLSTHVARFGLLAEIVWPGNHSNYHHWGFVDVPVMDLPAKGTSLGTPKLQAVKPVDSVETRFADCGPDSYRKCLREELTLSLNQHLGPTWQGSHSSNSHNHFRFTLESKK